MMKLRVVCLAAWLQRPLLPWSDAPASSAKKKRSCHSQWHPWRRLPHLTTAGHLWVQHRTGRQFQDGRLTVQRAATYLALGAWHGSGRPIVASGVLGAACSPVGGEEDEHGGCDEGTRGASVDSASGADCPRASVTEKERRPAAKQSHWPSGRAGASNEPPPRETLSWGGWSAATRLWIQGRGLRVILPDKRAVRNFLIIPFPAPPPFWVARHVT